MPGRKQRYMERLFQIAVLVFLGLLLIWPALALEPGWQDVPQRLKQEDGVQRQGEFLYATGMAKAVNSARPDKTHEVARKKSLLRALQLAHLTSSCQELVVSLDEEERRQFIRLFASVAPTIHIKGLTVIRQWEKDRTHFTTVAVPLAELEHLPCNFSNLSEAITRYAEFEHVSSEGLAFCLRHVPRYSILYETIRQRVGLLFQKQGYTGLALCFLHNQNSNPARSALETLAFQNRVDRAAKLTRKAEKLAEQGQWADAVTFATEALNLVPTYARPYLVIADFFLHRLKKPTFALCAAEKALRDGTSFNKALSRVVSCLEEMSSPETEIFKFLFSQTEQVDEKWSAVTWSAIMPGNWKGEVKRFADNPVQNLVLFSLGQFVVGPSAPPAPEFDQAATLYGQAKNDADVEHVLELLLQACEKQPKSAKTYNLIGACYRHLGKPSLALPFLWQALTLEPGYDFALTNLGLCCQNLGLMKSARFYFEQEAVKNSSNSWVQSSYVKFNERFK